MRGFKDQNLLQFCFYCTEIKKELTPSDLGQLLNIFARSTTETRVAITDTNVVVATATPGALNTSWGTTARVLGDGAVVHAVGVGFPVVDVDGVAAGRSLVFVPVRELGAGLFVHGILGRRAFHQRAVRTTETNIAFAAVVEIRIPGAGVSDTEVVVVIDVALLLLGDGLGEVGGEVNVGAADAVAGAVVGAGGTLAGRTFVAVEARAFTGGAIADTSVRALDVGRVGRGAFSFDPGSAARASHLGAISTSPHSGTAFRRLKVASAMVKCIAGTVATARVGAGSGGEADSGGKNCGEELHCE